LRGQRCKFITGKSPGEIHEESSAPISRLGLASRFRQQLLYCSLSLAAGQPFLDIFLAWTKDLSTVALFGALKSSPQQQRRQPSEDFRAALISVATLKRIESSSGIRGAADTLWKIQQALARAGIEFIAEEAGKGPGVRVKHALDRHALKATALS
jgi:hypothetical protein